MSRFTTSSARTCTARVRRAASPDDPATIHAPTRRVPTAAALSADRGSLLIVTLILTVVLASVVLAITSYAAVGLRMTKVTDERMARLAAAEVGVWWAAEQLVDGVDCSDLHDRSRQQADLRLNGASVEVRCEHVQPSADVPGTVYVVSGIAHLGPASTRIDATVQIADYTGSYQVLDFSIRG